MTFSHLETRVLPPIRLRTDPLVGSNAIRVYRVKPLLLGPDLYGRPPVTLPDTFVSDTVHKRTNGLKEEVIAYQLGGEWSINPTLNMPQYLKSTVHYVLHAAQNYSLIIGNNDVALYNVKKLHDGPIVSFAHIIEKGKKVNNLTPSFRVLFDEIPFPNGKRAGVWATISFDPNVYSMQNFVGNVSAAVTQSIARFPTAPQEVRKYMQITYHIDTPV